MHSGMSADRLDDLQRLAHQRRLGLVRVHRGDAGIDVEDVGARRDLGQRVLDHRVEIAGLHFGGELLAARRVDALADHREGPVEADDVLRWRRRRGCGSLGFASIGNEGLETCLGEFGFEIGLGLLDFGGQIVAHRDRLGAPPVGEIVVGSWWPARAWRPCRSPP